MRQLALTIQDTAPSRVSENDEYAKTSLAKALAVGPQMRAFTHVWGTKSR